MARFSLFAVSTVLFLMLKTTALAQSDAAPPVTYEVMINGESFRVEGNRMVKVQSKEKPGTTYEIAIQVSPTQLLRLNSVRLEYEMPARITDNRGKEQRIVQIKHELGFTVMITDLGQPLDAGALEGALKVLTDFAAEQARQQKAEQLTIGEPHDRKFEGAKGRGSKIHFQDSKGVGQTCLAYVLTGEKFTATCIVQFADKDSEDVLPLIKKTLDSIRGLP